MYNADIKPSCKKSLRKAAKKNPLLKEAFRKKKDEILENPHHYKPLRHNRTGERRVHLLSSFVLIYEIDEKKRLVTFLAFEHHDDAYRR